MLINCSNLLFCTAWLASVFVTSRHALMTPALQMARQIDSMEIWFNLLCRIISPTESITPSSSIQEWFLRRQIRRHIGRNKCLIAVIHCEMPLKNNTLQVDVVIVDMLNTLVLNSLPVSSIINSKQLYNLSTHQQIHLLVKHWIQTQTQA